MADNFGEIPDWANPDYKRRRRILFALLGVGIAVLVVGLVFFFTQQG